MRQSLVTVPEMSLPVLIEAFNESYSHFQPLIFRNHSNQHFRHCSTSFQNEPMCLEAVVSYMWNTAAALIGWICRMVIDATVDTVDIACFFIIYSKVQFQLFSDFS